MLIKFAEIAQPTTQAGLLNLIFIPETSAERYQVHFIENRFKGLGLRAGEFSDPSSNETGVLLEIEIPSKLPINNKPGKKSQKEKS